MLSAIGLVIIAYCLMFFKDTDLHPGFVSLFVVSGTTLFILFTKENSFIYKILTLKISIFFGVISYSLYLYHQPILVFYRFTYGEIGNKIFIALFLLMVLLSYLSYRFFEHPIRKSKNNKKYLILLFFILFILAFYKGAKYTNGYEFRQSQEVRESLKHFENVEWIKLENNKKGINFRAQEILRCDDRLPEYACKFISDYNSKNLILLGDSYVGVFGKSFVEKDDLNITFIEYGQCSLLEDSFWFGVPECFEINKLRWIELETIKPTNILVGVNFIQFYQAKRSVNNFKFGQKNIEEKVDKELVFASFRRSIERLISFGYNPIILLQPPNPIIDVAKEMKRKSLDSNYKYKEDYQATPTTIIDNEIRETLKGLNVTFIDMNAKMCKDDKCLTFNKNGGLFNNGSHLSYFGAQLFVDDIIKSLKD